MRPLHVGVPGARHRQAARPARDRAQGRRGDGGHRHTRRVSPPLGVDKEITVGANSLFERITAEELWACTTCKACDEICPVNIEITDKIFDMRRYLSLMESNFPAELGNAYRAMENQGNPWGLNQGERGDWADGIDGVTIVDPGETLDTEYLYWVGCAGSFDDKNKKVTQAMAKLLRRAGIDVAILGPSEMCTGDSARRSGNEYLFQMLAQPNVEMLNGMGVKKIITQCPHCFNTLLNEYPQIGGNYEVIHHTQLLEQLIDSGQLDVSPGDARRADHVPRLVLPRSPQRRLRRAAQGRRLDQGRRGRRDAAQRHEGHVLRRRRRAHVDGGDDRARRSTTSVPPRRCRPARSRVATACPFCYIMMDDGVKGAGVEEDQVKVADIAIHLLDAIEHGESKMARPEAHLNVPLGTPLRVPGFSGTVRPARQRSNRPPEPRPRSARRTRSRPTTATTSSSSSASARRSRRS